MGHSLEVLYSPWLTAWAWSAAREGGMGPWGSAEMNKINNPAQRARAAARSRQRPPLRGLPRAPARRVCFLLLKEGNEKKKKKINPAM